MSFLLELSFKDCVCLRKHYDKLGHWQTMLADVQGVQGGGGGGGGGQPPRQQQQQPQLQVRGDQIADVQGVQGGGGGGGGQPPRQQQQQQQLQVRGD